MASLNLSGNNNNYYKIEAGDEQGTWALTLPSQNDTLATVSDVFQLGSPWKFKGGADVTSPVPKDQDGNPVSVAGDAWVNDTNGIPNAEWVGLDRSRMIPKDALLVLDDGGYWHELSSSEIDPIFQASPSSKITDIDIGKWNESWEWKDHADAGYLTQENAETLGYNAYGISIWSDPATQAKIPRWDDAYNWGDHRDGDEGKKYLTEETDPVFLASVAHDITATDVEHWDTAYGWGDHRDGKDGNKYLTEVKTLNSIGDVTVPTPATDEVLTAVVSGNNVEWQSKKVNVIVKGELIFKGAIDAITQAPKETPEAGHIYVHNGGEENPNDEYALLSDWAPVEKAKFGAKLAYGDDKKWHNIGNAGVGTDLTSFNAINSDEVKVGGELTYDNTTGTFTYFKTDTYSTAELITKFSEKADKSDVYKKSETYNREEIHHLLTLKANKGESYSKDEADEILQGVRQNEAIFMNKNTVGDGIIKSGWNGLSGGPMLQTGNVIIESDAAWTITGGGSGGAINTSIFELEATPMYAEFQAVKKRAERVAQLEEEVQELKGMVKQLIKGIK